ncbi:MAG: TonB-dependent receptor domain-containing protein [Ignavibacteriales bacterium]
MGNKSFQRRLLGGAAAVVLMAAWGSAHAEDVTFNIAPQPLASALNQFGAQSDTAVLVRPDLAGSKTTKGVTGAASAEVALNTLLQGTGLTWRRDGDTFLIEAADPQSGSAAGDGADAGTVAALVVTAQKREENIQDVPIAISAFTEKSLQEQKIEGGFDLLKAIPNVTFSKNNFTSYNFSIRGIGTKAVSATTDPGVAVSFNNVALIQNRLFEQEYFDVERVEVLRGPQGTLYGRNATAGVINVISAKPNLTEFSGWLKGEVGNYHTKRLSAMLNVPLVEDKLGVRVAGALTDRQGYDYNSVTQHHVNGRDLWSGRVTFGFNPTESVRTSLIWERFNENDNRSRTGKQLCHHDDGPAALLSYSLTQPQIYQARDVSIFKRALFSQGCKPGSLYDDGAFGTPNGLSMPFVFASLFSFPIGLDADGHFVSPLKYQDPYGGLTQSRDLRTIASFRDPKYRAKADVFEFNLDADLGDALTLTSQTAYDRDTVYSFQDYNRFNTLPIFTDPAADGVTLSPWIPDMLDGGVFCDPQLGCSKTMAGFDISQAKSSQFTQEFRLQSNFDGPINFSAGANYTKFNVIADYYVMYNLISLIALGYFNGDETWTNATPNLDRCIRSGFGFSGPTDMSDPAANCPYVDPNPVESINGEGHNYFRSKNPYKLRSYGIFGETYLSLSDRVKITAGLRYNDDRKAFTPVPTQVLMSKGLFGGGYANRGYPEDPQIKQHWGAWSGRLGVDWTPELKFTDKTLFYAFYSRGYKAGGANPPRPGFATFDQQAEQALASGFPQALIDWWGQIGVLPVLQPPPAEYEPTFRPEYVNAFELGSKNTLLGGALTLNANTFFYDYKDYQVSQIRDRTAVNENFDAKVWGFEMETLFSPTRDLQLVANIGFLDSAIANGMKSIDVMNRTQGHADWIVAKPWIQYPSNCIVPIGVAKYWADEYQTVIGGGASQFWLNCGRIGGILGFMTQGATLYDVTTGLPYNVADHPEVNGGAGFYADLGGNKLPNAPHWTANLGAQYGHDIVGGSWRATVRADAYWQSQSWARVYNLDPYDKLHGWYNVNLSVWLERPEDDLKIEFYAKNLLDKTPITDAFLNSDDTALTTNVFVLDPRLIGLSIRKGF